MHGNTMQENNVKSTWKFDLLRLNDMFTPKIITVIYWLLLFAVAINFIIRVSTAGTGFSFGHFMVDLLYLVGGAVVVRIWCEILIVVFKINEALQDIRKK